MRLSEAQRIVLSHIAGAPVDIRRVSEPYRQRAIDLGITLLDASRALERSGKNRPVTARAHDS